MSIKVRLKSSRHIGVLTGRGSETVFLEPNKVIEVDFADERSMNTVLDYKFAEVVKTKSEVNQPVAPKEESKAKELPKNTNTGKAKESKKDKK